MFGTAMQQVTNVKVKKVADKKPVEKKPTESAEVTEEADAVSNKIQHPLNTN